MPFPDFGFAPAFDPDDEAHVAGLAGIVDTVVNQGQPGNNCFTLMIWEGGQTHASVISNVHDLQTVMNIMDDAKRQLSGDDKLGPAVGHA